MKKFKGGYKIKSGHYYFPFILLSLIAALFLALTVLSSPSLAQGCCELSANCADIDSMDCTDQGGTFIAGNKFCNPCTAKCDIEDTDPMDPNNIVYCCEPPVGCVDVANLSALPPVECASGSVSCNVFVGATCDAGTGNCENPTGTCGDGNLDPGEVCDDGGESATCDTNCTAVICGDGTLNMTAGEGCDDGNNVGGDGCRANCTTEVCGDGILDPGEACDDGNNVDSDGCSANCLLEFRDLGECISNTVATNCSGLTRRQRADCVVEQIINCGLLFP